jgi:hypothetical protein
MRTLQISRLHSEIKSNLFFKFQDGLMGLDISCKQNKTNEMIQS